MKGKEQSTFNPEQEAVQKAIPEQEKRAHAISRYIQNRVIEKNASVSDEEEKEIQQSLADMSASEKAIHLYQYLVSYSLESLAQKKETGGQEEQVDQPSQNIADPYLIGEIKILWNDVETRRLFLEKYTEARIDAKTFRLSHLGKQLREQDADVARLEENYRTLRQALNLKRVTRPTEIAATQSKLERTTKDLLRVLSDREKIVTLAGHERTKENTDVAATIMFDTLMRYHEEAKAGFAWLPSRRELHQKILDVMYGSDKAPVLIGPPGTGKTSQLNAVALDLTNEPILHIPCENTLGDEGLVAKRDFRAGEGAYDYEGCIAEAYTGYKHSKDTEPSFPHGRMVNLDEISQLNLEKALGPLKGIRQAKEGEPLNRYIRRKVLPGAFLSATTNSPITDERLDREFGRVPTNYFEMNTKNPELYEFMLGKLLQDDKSFPSIAESELAPAYTDIPVSSGEELSDGSVIIGKKELIMDSTSTKHGYLYRLTYAIRALQDSYIHGSKFNEKHLADTALYYDDDDKGNIIITGYVPDLEADNATVGVSGTMLTLEAGASTLTPNMISRWMEGFKSRMSSKNPKDHTQTFSEWIQLQLENHIDQTSPDDGEKIRALLNHFHLFDPAPSLQEVTPLTPKETGYLSPRVPRPVDVEKLKTKTPSVEDKTPTKAEAHTTTQVLLEAGEKVLIKIDDFTFKTPLSEQFTIHPGMQFMIKGTEYVFAGMVEEKDSDKNGKLAGSLVDERELHELFNEEEVEIGIIDWEISELDKTVKELCKSTM